MKSPNPAFADVDVPLASTFMLSTKKGKEAYVEPVIEGRGYRFTVKVGAPPDPGAVKLGTTAGKRSAFRCLMSGIPVTYAHIRSEGKAGRMGVRLMAIVAEGDRGRVYLSPMAEHETVAREAAVKWKPDMPLPDNPRDFKTPNYGLTTYADLFTPRQLVALTTFSDLVGEAMEQVHRDHMAAQAPEQHQPGEPNRPGHPHFESSPLRGDDDGFAASHSRRQTGERAQREAEALGATNDDTPLRDGGTGARAYADAVGVYLAFGVEQGL